MRSERRQWRNYDTMNNFKRVSTYDLTFPPQKNVAQFSDFAFIYSVSSSRVEGKLVSP